mmetsp:Transcript_50094/g.95692  ORF Transcript_50094/g.95692 Transcript_50094/m.95692 type:complete len:300 (-) Transcript_50094:945-1844(-)
MEIAAIASYQEILCCCSDVHSSRHVRLNVRLHVSLRVVRGVWSVRLAGGGAGEVLEHEAEHAPAHVVLAAPFAHQKRGPVTLFDESGGHAAKLGQKVHLREPLKRHIFNLCARQVPVLLHLLRSGPPVKHPAPLVVDVRLHFGQVRLVQILQVRVREHDFELLERARGEGGELLRFRVVELLRKRGARVLQARDDGVQRLHLHLQGFLGLGGPVQLRLRASCRLRQLLRRLLRLRLRRRQLLRQPAHHLLLQRNRPVCFLQRLRQLRHLLAQLVPGGIALELAHGRLQSLYLPACQVER